MTEISSDVHGRCTVCGSTGRFRYKEVVPADSREALSCGWDEAFRKVINKTNSMDCGYCYAKSRVRAVGEIVLRHFRRFGASSCSDLLSKVPHDGSVQIFESAAVGGVFSNFYDPSLITRSEFFDDVARGEVRNGVRSEDLQSLTFKDATFDIVLCLDVLEHVAEPWVAVTEMNRVLKPGGIAVVTVPIDLRVKETATVARLKGPEIEYFKPASFHIDPLRENGALVFTEFGMDFVEQLRRRQLNAEFEVFSEGDDGIVQLVAVIHKT